MPAVHSPTSQPKPLRYPDDLDVEQQDDEDDKVPEGYDASRDGKFGPEKQAEKWDGKWGPFGKAMGWLIRNGCEARGIQPVRVEDRIILSNWSYLPQATLWAAGNTNILTIS